jgi:hypothetical protein
VGLFLAVEIFDTTLAAISQFITFNTRLRASMLVKKVLPNLQQRSGSCVQENDKLALYQLVSATKSAPCQRGISFARACQEQQLKLTVICDYRSGEFSSSA